MKEDQQLPLEDFEEYSKGPLILHREKLAVDSIDLESFLNPGLTCSGSFDLRGVHTSSLGKLLQALPIPAMVVGASFQIIFVNQSCAKITANYEKILGKSFSSLFPTPSSVKEAQSLIEAIFLSRQSQVVESVLQIDDTRIWARMNFRSLRVGNIRSILLLIEDLTPEKKQLLINQKYQDELRKARDELEKRVTERTEELILANRTLEEIERRQKALLDNIPDMAWLKDKDGRFISVNQPFGQACGFLPEDLAGKTDFDVWASEVAEKYVADDEFVRKTRCVKRAEELFADANGNIRWMETIRTPIMDEQGQVIGTTGVARDITRRKQAEESLRESLREKEALLQEVHHRVKNNLQIVSSLLALQEGSFDDPKIREIFRESQTRIRSMASLHEKLYVSKDLAKIDFADYVRDLTGTLLQYYPESGARIRLNLEIDQVFLSVSTALACGLIINELVSNSLKYAFEGGPGEITIRFSQREGVYHLTVADNGKGFPPDFDHRRTKSLGMKLVTNLTELQLVGAIEVGPGPGVEMNIIFKESKAAGRRSANGKREGNDS